MKVLKNMLAVITMLPVAAIGLCLLIAITSKSIEMVTGYDIVRKDIHPIFADWSEGGPCR